MAPSPKQQKKFKISLFINPNNEIWVLFFFIEALRALRLRELQKEALCRINLQSEGHGAVSTVTAKNLHKVIKESIAEHIVCHFAIEGDTLGQAIDQNLESLASQFLGTNFLRCPVPPSSIIPRNFGLSSAPGLVAFYQGTIIATCSVFELDCADDEVDDAVVSWLKKRKCLVTSIDSAGEQNLKQVLAGTSSIVSDESEEDDGNEWQKPCEECGRRYPHQHIRSIYTGNANVQGSENDSDSDS